MIMNAELRDRLIKIAKEKISDADVSHDVEHAIRVLSNAERIARKEGGDFDVIVPAALFHDLVVYQKNHPEKHKSQEESAEAAEKILNTCSDFSKDKIGTVRTCIMECSFSKGIIPDLLESKILQDADGLESTGAIAVMRAFSSAGQMQMTFYDPDDPFCKKHEPKTLKFALDLFYGRLLKITGRMHTETAKKIAQRRTNFLIDFLKELELELEGK